MRQITHPSFGLNKHYHHRRHVFHNKCRGYSGELLVDHNQLCITSGLNMDGLCSYVLQPPLQLLAVLWAHGTDYCENNKCPDSLKTVTSFYGYVFATCVGLGGLAFLFSCICLIFHGIVSCRQHRYNEIGTNNVSEPIFVGDRHPQGSTEYRPLA
ncbi:hypothetical protein HZS61_010938 [Fusarium oxysporum f. sp. conglutinans]|uniref:Uncharacterized protein n=1 Tax=Fusarium oxysporum f. sp. conglutinans TaxID=100902 RepID=A0A8H6GVH4_FUSOX|nr:hypothetical protein HZS61_010938 [Fusarium oxysporum f. sp. conglutinans]